MALKQIFPSIFRLPIIRILFVAFIPVYLGAWMNVLSPVKTPFIKK
uniref:Mitochondrial protein n=1 Tax=Siphoviridae sp. ctnpt50 TaxID=2827941 RepID=A0A8S5SEC5_9CAUD|nr:MAG TPA: Putative mitochondrial precursor protein [Siphoviridae sp. ctnpt50]DAR32806.1 MAG TPA: Putative mitochondrial precursor protein [Caudoviricetes sp.]